MQTEQKISILGCGWLGFPLAKKLIQEGYQVKGSTTSPEKLPQLAEIGIEPFLVDLTDTTFENLTTFLNTEIAIICFPPKIRSGKGEAYLSQIQLLQKAIQQATVKHLIFISSTSVYPDTNATITEHSAIATSLTAQTLVQAEEIVRSTSLPCTFIRFAGLVGNDRHPGRFFAGKKDVPNPLGPVNLIHLDDCTQIIEQVIKQHKWNELYNACSDHHPSRQEFYTAAAASLGLPLPQFAEPKQEDTFKIINNVKLKKDLNYRFIYPDPMFFKELLR